MRLLKATASSMRNWKKEYKNSRYGLQKRAACVLLAGIGLALTSCQRSRVVVRELAVQTPRVEVQQEWKYKTDTLYRYETDSILIETFITDTVIRQRVETKPLYITLKDTVFDDSPSEENKRLKEENKWLKQKDDTRIYKLAGGFAVIAGLCLLGLRKK